MRWSWTSFVAGATAGAVVIALLWLTLSSPDPLQPPRPRGGAAAPDSAEGPTPYIPILDGADSPPSLEAARGPTEDPTSAEATGRRPRVHANPTDDRVAQGADDGASGTVLDASGTFIGGQLVHLDTSSSDGRFRIRFGKSGDGDRIFLYMGGNRSSRYVAPQTLARARSRAAESGRTGGRAAEDLLAAEGYDARETGVGVALATSPPRIDLLLEAVADASYPALQGAALLAAYEVAPEDPDVIAAVLRSARAGDPDLRQAAIGLFPAVGEPAVAAAVEMLRTGDYVDDVLEPLARTVAEGGRAGDLLASRPDPAAALRVVEATMNLGDPQIVASVPNLLRPLLETPEASTVAPTLFASLAPAHPGFLRDVVTSPGLARAVRIAALDALLAADGLRGEGVQAAAAVIADFRAPVPLVRAVIGKLTVADLDGGAASGALWSASETHPSAWVRDDALAKLRAAGHSGGAALVVHRAVYGKGRHTIDVTEAVRSKVTGGALRELVGNHLGGDPIEGAVKELRVEYSVGGKRFVRVVNEFETLVLP